MVVARFKRSLQGGRGEMDHSQSCKCIVSHQYLVSRSHSYSRWYAEYMMTIENAANSQALD